MGLSVEVSKNVDDYQESMLLGMDGKKSFVVIKSVVAGGLVTALLSFIGIPTETALIMAVFMVSAPIVLFSLYKKDNLTLKEILHKKYKNPHSGAYIIRNNNKVSQYKRYVDEEIEQRQREEQEKEKKQFGIRKAG